MKPYMHKQIAKLLPVLGMAAAVLLLASACSPCQQQQQPQQKNVQRFASVTGLRPEKADYYRELHANAWPAINRKIKECNIQNYSIYEIEIEGKPYLFSYFEYTGADFAADMKKMADDPETRRWWKETDPCQLPLPQAAAKNQIWTDAKEVYRLR